MRQHEHPQTLHRHVSNRQQVSTAQRVAHDDGEQDSAEVGVVVTTSTDEMAAEPELVHKLIVSARADTFGGQLQKTQNSL